MKQTSSVVRNAMTRPAVALIAFLTATLLQSAPPQVSNVTLEVKEFSRIVKVGYTTDGAGVATCRFLDDSAPIGAPGAVRTLTGAINSYLAAGSHEFTWNAGRDLPDHVFEKLTAEITLWATNSLPEYCAVHLVEINGRYPVSWYGSGDTVPFGTTSHLYKTDHLLLRQIPASDGNYIVLGSPTYEAARDPNRELQRCARITSPFYIGVYELTQLQWQQVGGRANSAKFKVEGATRPMEQISYYEIRENRSANYSVGHPDYTWPETEDAVHPDSFMGTLRSMSGNLLKFDLPTEAQWEYACRAGTKGRYNVDDANIALLARYLANGGEVPGEYSEDTVPPDKGGTAKVGSYLPNAWGLYDMLGNLYEFCLDWSADTTDPDALDTMSGGDPKGPPSAPALDKRVARGGYWAYGNNYCRSAHRHHLAPGTRHRCYGFRVAAPATILIPPLP